MSKSTKVFLLTVGLIFGFALMVSAQQIQNATSVDATEELNLDENVTPQDLGVPEPTLLPDSPFYFLKNWGRRLRTIFAFRPVDKANLKLRFASEKLLEARKLVQKTKNSDILKKATENYENEINRIKDIIDKIKEKATENPKVGKFLDKFIKQQILHQKILEKLEEQVPPEVFQKIKEAREKHLQRFGKVMQKLEDKTKIPERLEKNLETLRGSRFKNFKNLDILKRLEEKVPEQTKEAIRKARERILENLKKKVEQMSTTTQERFKNYIERIRGEAGDKMEILENIKSELRGKPAIRERLEKIREKIIEKLPEQIQLRRECPTLTPPAPGFCKEGRIVIEKDANGCPLTPRCIVPAEQEIKPLPILPKKEAPITETPKTVCISIWNPVCGKNGKTYSNACFAKVAGVEIAYRGTCKREILKEGVGRTGE